MIQGQNLEKIPVSNYAHSNNNYLLQRTWLYSQINSLPNQITYIWKYSQSIKTWIREAIKFLKWIKKQWDNTPVSIKTFIHKFNKVYRSSLCCAGRPEAMLIIIKNLKSTSYYFLNYFKKYTDQVLKNW